MRYREIIENKTRLDPKCWKGKKIGNPKTKVKGGVHVNNCVPMEDEVEEGWKSALAGAALAGATALGSAGAQAKGPDAGALQKAVSQQVKTQSQLPQPKAPQIQQAKQHSDQDAPISYPKVNRYDDDSSTLKVYEPGKAFENKKSS
jgi:hypothetical protein